MPLDQLSWDIVHSGILKLAPKLVPKHLYLHFLRSDLWKFGVATAESALHWLSHR